MRSRAPESAQHARPWLTARAEGRSSRHTNQGADRRHRRSRGRSCPPDPMQSAFARTRVRAARPPWLTARTAGPPGPLRERANPWVADTTFMNDAHVREVNCGAGRRTLVEMHESGGRSATPALARPLPPREAQIRNRDAISARHGRRAAPPGAESYCALVRARRPESGRLIMEKKGGRNRPPSLPSKECSLNSNYQSRLSYRP